MYKAASRTVLGNFRNTRNIVPALHIFRIHKNPRIHYLSTESKSESKSAIMTDRPTPPKPELVRVFSPPQTAARGMKTLDKDAFLTKVPLVVALLGNVSVISQLNREASEDLLFVSGISRVVTVNSKKGVLLKHDITDVSQLDNQLSESTKQLLQKADVEYQNYTLELGYDYFKTDEVLSVVLPKDLLEAEGGAPPSGFTAVGHIAHMNIRDEFLPYRYLIGQVILDKNRPSIRTVVNKLDTIDNVYRTFDMEVLAGDKDFDVEQSESGCRFQFNFAKVYWNSRLHTEHGRLIDQFHKGDLVCDVFAGVGPFAVPAGKKAAVVLANDLNPESFKSLEHNIGLNKVADTVYPFNLDGRDFIKQAMSLVQKLHKEKHSVIKLPTKTSNKRRKTPNEQSAKVAVAEPDMIEIPKQIRHFVMNLPDSAITFLDGFIGLYGTDSVREFAFGSASKDSIQQKDMPFIHVHCFHKSPAHLDEPEPEDVVYAALLERIHTALNFQGLKVEDLYFQKVRKVAPTKIMYCITFQLPREVALA